MSISSFVLNEEHTIVVTTDLDDAHAPAPRDVIFQTRRIEVAQHDGEYWQLTDYSRVRWNKADRSTRSRRNVCPETGEVTFEVVSVRRYEFSSYAADVGRPRRIDEAEAGLETEPDVLPVVGAALLLVKEGEVR